jgi:adenylate kinase
MKLIEPKILVFLGPQGSGKGTQSIQLADALQLPRAEAGQLCRDEAKLDTPLGRSVKALLDKGDYLPTELWRPIIEKKLATMDGSRGLVFDGFLRTKDQLAAYEEFRHEFHLPEAIIIYLNLSREKAVERLMKRGRVDDTPELIAKRLDWSKSQVKEILDHFRELGKVIEIDGDHSIEVVQQEIRDALTANHLIA